MLTMLTTLFNLLYIFAIFWLYVFSKTIAVFWNCFSYFWAKRFLSAFGQFEPLPRHFSYLANFSFSKFLYILGYMFDNCVSISGLT